MRKRLTTVLVAISATGCAVGPDYAPPEVAVPAAWHAPAISGEAGLVKWWEIFEDPALNRLIDEAARSNYDLRVAQARVREARAARGVVAADLYPHVNVAGTYQRMEVPVPDGGDSSGLTFGLNANAQGISRSATLRSGPFTALGSSSVPRLGTILGAVSNAQQGGQGGGLLRQLLPSNSSSLSFSPGGAPSFDRTQDFYQVGFDAAWEIDVFGGNRRAVEAADADIESAVESRRDVLVSLFAEVARNYLTLREAQARLAIAEENIEAQQRTVEIAQARFDAGLTSQFDVTRARAQLATTQSQVPALQTAVSANIHRLSVLLALDPAALYDELVQPGVLPPTPPEVPAGVPSDLLRRRADVRRAERTLAASTARIGAAMADLFPRFSLTGNIGSQGSSAGDLTLGTSRFFGFGPTISWPVFDAGRIRSNIEVQNARQEQALALYEKTVNESLEDVETSLVAYANEQERREILNQAVESNRHAVRLANELYTTGLSDFVDVLEAQRTLYLSEDQLVQSQTTVLLNLVALYKALGGGWESFEPADTARAEPVAQ